MIEILSPLALLLMQVGPNPVTGGVPGTPDELRDRPPPPARLQQGKLASCLQETNAAPEKALDTAQRWREKAANDLESAQSAHCLGLALVKLSRYDEAQRVFDLASGEAPVDNPGYAARLSAMAGNAAMAQGNAEAALPLLDRAGDQAALAGDRPLTADLRVDLARVLVQLGRQEDASRALTEARDADPEDAQAWLLSATLSRRLERLGEAQAQVERAATLAPRDPQVGLEAGVIAALSGREADARASFASVVEVAPGTSEAERAQAYITQLDGGA